MTQVQRPTLFNPKALFDASGNYVPDAVRMFDLAQRIHEASRLQAHELLVFHPRELAR